MVIESVLAWTLVLVMEWAPPALVLAMEWVPALVLALVLALESVLASALVSALVSALARALTLVLTWAMVASALASVLVPLEARCMAADTKLLLSEIWASRQLAGWLGERHARERFRRESGEPKRRTGLIL